MFYFMFLLAPFTSYLVIFTGHYACLERYANIEFNLSNWHAKENRPDDTRGWVVFSLKNVCSENHNFFKL